MLSGLLKAGVPSTNILGIVRDKKKAEIKYKEAGVKFTENAEDILEFNGDKVHVLLLCIPPKLVKSYIKKNIVAISKCDPILVNACAGIMYSQMRGWLIDGFREANMHNEKQLWNPRLCIVMPSISIATLEGIALCYLKNLSESDLEIVNHFVGLVSKQVARVNDERELYGSVYAGGQLSHSPSLFLIFHLFGYPSRHSC